jgi:hypothetical protein
VRCRVPIEALDVLFMGNELWEKQNKEYASLGMFHRNPQVVLVLIYCDSSGPRGGSKNQRHASIVIDCLREID